MSVPPVPPDPNQGPPGKEGPPPAAREVPQLPADDPFADIVAHRAKHIDLIGQTRITAEERTANIQRRRADAADEAVAQGRALARQLRAAETGDTTVQLSEEHQQIMIAGGLEGAELGVDQVRGALQTALQRLSLSGNASIFRPDHHNATAQEGKRRLDGENTYVAVQAAAMELAREDMSAGNFSQGFATLGQFGIKIDELPEWVTHDVDVYVDTIDTSSEGALQKLADLHNIIPISADERMQALNAQDNVPLSTFAKLWKKAEAARVQIKETKRQQEEAAKRAKRTERLKTLEADTYAAAIAAGRESFTTAESNLQAVRNVGFQVHAIELPERTDRLVIPFGTLAANNEAFKAIMLSESRQYSREGQHVAQLRVLQRVVEDEDLLTSCADTLATFAHTDWTGWSAQDYKEVGNENGWREHWRTSLRQAIHGYAIGMMQQATEYDASANVGRSDFNQRRSHIARIGMEILFDDLSILSAEDVAKMDPMQIEARNRLGAYRSSLTEPARSIFDGYLTGNTEVLTLAATEVRDRKAGVANARADRIAKEEAVLKELADSEGAVASALVAIESLRLGEVEDARSLLTRLQEFQRTIGQQPFGTWVELHADRNAPRLVVSAKTRAALLSRRDELSAQVPHAEGAQAARIELRGVESQLRFMEALDERLNLANNTTSVKRRPLFKGGDRRVFSNVDHFYGPFREPHQQQGEITDEASRGLEQSFQRLFGERGQYAALQQKFTAGKDQLAKAGKTATARQSGIAGMQQLAREAHELTRQIYDLIERNKQGGIYNGDPVAYAASTFMYEVALPGLRKKGLVTENRYG